MALQERLATDLTLQPLLTQFVSIHLDTTRDEWQKWEQQFPSKSNGIPIIYVVRADRESLYAASGSLPGPALPQLLAETLAKAGKQLNEAQLKKIADGVAKAAKAHEQGNVADAVVGVMRFAGSGSYAEAALAADALVQQLADEARQKIESGGKKLEDETTSLSGAIELAAVSRLYKKLPGIAKAVKETSARHTATARELFAQAALIDQAKVYEEQQQPAKAAVLYEQLIEKYAGSPGAELARGRLDALSPAAKKLARQENGSKRPSSESAKKAASLLKMAHVFAKGKPDKARQYAEQVIELAPDSPEAKEARSLIKSLDSQ
ncbi:MAG TPA: tetratricopeptide repeat protein [Pirellulales bacterium]|nr:tetratricopeptide repeat protein [Pirellulales bacterium]